MFLSGFLRQLLSFWSSPLFSALPVILTTKKEASIRSSPGPRVFDLDQSAFGKETAFGSGALSWEQGLSTYMEGKGQLWQDLKLEQRRETGSMKTTLKSELPELEICQSWFLQKQAAIFTLHPFRVCVYVCVCVCSLIFTKRSKPLRHGFK